MSLVYSGNFLAEAEVDPFGTARLRIGIHPEAFAWRLEPGATFTTPEAVIAWSGDGLGAPQRGAPRPVPRSAGAGHRGATARARSSSTTGRRPTSTSTTTGSWGSRGEPKALGVELFVLDDGWFGRRDNDDSSLGDWVVDRRKLPGGIEALVSGRQGPGAAVRPVDRARDGQRGQRPVPRPPRLGDRRPRPRADGEPAAARARLRATRGRGPHRGRADRGALERADRLRQVGHEPQHHRAVDGVGPGRPPGRVLPPLHPRACTSCTGA